MSSWDPDRQAKRVRGEVAPGGPARGKSGAALVGGTVAPSWEGWEAWTTSNGRDLSHAWGGWQSWATPKEPGSYRSWEPWEPMALGCLRAVCLGDSWVSDRADDPSVACGYRVCSPIVEALQEGLVARGVQAECAAAGFPGATAERISKLAQVCRLKELSLLCETGRSIKYDLDELLASEGLPCLRTLQRNNVSLYERVDIVVMILGSNDIDRGASSTRVLRLLHKLRYRYRRSGADVITVSLGGWMQTEALTEAEQSADEERRKVNDALFDWDGVVDCDKLLEGLDPALWEECGWHLKPAGYTAMGHRLADAIAARYLAPEVEGLTLSLPSASLEHASPAVSGAFEPTLYVHGTASQIFARVVAGLYAPEGTTPCGRPIYKKRGARGSAAVFLFYWPNEDSSGSGGWWFSPSLDWDDPGWARHEDSLEASATPPRKGWRVPPDGPVDSTLHVIPFQPCTSAAAQSVLAQGVASSQLDILKQDTHGSPPPPPG